MKTRAEIEAALDVLDWKLIDGPRLTSEGWRGTIARGSLLFTTFAPREEQILPDLLRRAQAYADALAKGSS